MPTLEQIKILIHLREMGLGTTETFRLLLGSDPTYAIGHLVRDKYISRHKDGLYTLLWRGIEMTTSYKNYQPVPSDKGARKKALLTSEIAVLCKRYGIKVSDELSENKNIFIPSAHWRRIHLGIISTARFLGVLLYRDMIFAVYDVDDEKFEWQGIAESSLFYRHHGAWETRADVMLMICRNNAPAMAAQIVRRTMQNKDRLIKNDHYSFEPVKPQKYSKAPVRLKSNYYRVLLCDWDDFKNIIDLAVDRDEIIENYHEKLGGTISPSVFDRQCDIEVYPSRYFINLENDLLRFVYLWDHVVWQEEEHDWPGYHKIDYHLIMREKYRIISEKIGCDTIYVNS